MNDPITNSSQARSWSKRLAWTKVFLQPALVLLAGVAVIVLLGLAQRAGWISAGGGDGAPSHASADEEDVRYICPMMCTPPQSEPGRCPVCAMELVPLTSRGGKTDPQAIHIDPAARRVANIRTVSVKSVPMIRNVRTIGEIRYDEGSLKTIAAYVDGRLERLYADYTGVVVQQGDRLAYLYSPKLHSAQVELLVAREAGKGDGTTTSRNVLRMNHELYESAKQRLTELGMTEPQFKQLEQEGKANSRLHLYAPISGTVIEKLAAEGDYVTEGQAIYKLADLSTVWLMLELFPEDAASVHYGQKVRAQVQSLPGREFAGRVAFVDPTVDPKTRTVGVRVVIPNEDGVLRVGDFAKATIDVPLAAGGPAAAIYDPALANKWISPRHPHVVESSSGACRVCGVDLVPAADFGFTDQPIAGGETLVVPRHAVLMAGDHSVVYVETEPGRFELRRVVLGPTSGDQIAILGGLAAGEQVAVSGNFLIDSQMQLAGNPSLIDPTKAESKLDTPESAKVIVALARLSDEDRAVAAEQRICPVSKAPLGSMGTPLKVDVDGRPIFVCCQACEKPLLSDPDKYLANLSQKDLPETDLPQMDLPPIAAPVLVASQGELPQMEPPRMKAPQGADDESPEIEQALAQLPAEDRELAREQSTCPVADMPLGSMGTPIKVDVSGRPVFLCCEGCRESLLAEPEKYLAKLDSEKHK